MRKLLCCLVITVLMCITTSTFAEYVKTGKMEVYASKPKINSGRSANLKAVTNPLGGDKNVFCVERVKRLKGVNAYDFYTVEGNTHYAKDGKTDITIKKTEQLKEAVWYANWFLNDSEGTDTEKAITQIAIWETLEALDGYKGKFVKGVEKLHELYKNSTSKELKLSEWAVAVSPSKGISSCIIWDTPGQNFLVHMPKTPEPATAMLFGFGLLWLSAISRRKIIR